MEKVAEHKVRNGEEKKEGEEKEEGNATKIKKKSGDEDEKVAGGKGIKGDEGRGGEKAAPASTSESWRLGMQY